MRLPQVKHLFFPRYPPHPSRFAKGGIVRSARTECALGRYPLDQSSGAPSFALFAKGGIVRSRPSTSHGKQNVPSGTSLFRQSAAKWYADVIPTPELSIVRFVFAF
jgi:hypothetical protein